MLFSALLSQSLDSTKNYKMIDVSLCLQEISQKKNIYTWSALVWTCYNVGMLKCEM